VKLDLLKSRVLFKVCSKLARQRWKRTCMRRVKLQITRTHSPLVISINLTAIAAFNSLIIWGWLWHTSPLRKFHWNKSAMFRSDERGAYSPLQFLLIDLAGNRPLIQNELFDSIIW